MRRVLTLLLAVLAMAPGAPLLAAAEAEAASSAGDEAMQARRPVDAILQYRRAEQLGFGDLASLSARIAGAEAQRAGLLRVCETTDADAGRRACHAALLPGAKDEARVYRRLGRIEEDEHQVAAALDAYRSAARLQSGDAEVSAAIARLTGAPPARLQGTASTLESDSFAPAIEAHYSNTTAPTFSH